MKTQTDKVKFSDIRADVLKGNDGFGHPEPSTPSWLVALDKQIQRSRGSTKRQLQSLRSHQLSKRDSPISDLAWTQRALADSQDLARKLEHEKDAWMQRAIVAEQTISDWQLLNQ